MAAPANTPIGQDPYLRLALLRKRRGGRDGLREVQIGQPEAVGRVERQRVDAAARYAIPVDEAVVVPFETKVAFHAELLRRLVEIVDRDDVKVDVDDRRVGGEARAGDAGQVGERACSWIVRIHELGKQILLHVGRKRQYARLDRRRRVSAVEAELRGDLRRPRRRATRVVCEHFDLIYDPAEREQQTRLRIAYERVDRYGEGARLEPRLRLYRRRVIKGGDQQPSSAAWPRELGRIEHAEGHIVARGDDRRDRRVAQEEGIRDIARRLAIPIVGKILVCEAVALARRVGGGACKVLAEPVDAIVRVVGVGRSVDERDGLRRGRRGAPAKLSPGEAAAEPVVLDEAQACGDVEVMQLKVSFRRTLLNPEVRHAELQCAPVRSKRIGAARDDAGDEQRVARDGFGVPHDGVDGVVLVRLVHWAVDAIKVEGRLRRVQEVQPIAIVRGGAVVAGSFAAFEQEVLLREGGVRCGEREEERNGCPQQHAPPRARGARGRPSTRPDRIRADSCPFLRYTILRQARAEQRGDGCVVIRQFGKSCTARSRPRVLEVQTLSQNALAPHSLAAAANSLFLSLAAHIFTHLQTQKGLPSIKRSNIVYAAIGWKVGTMCPARRIVTNEKSPGPFGV